MKVVYYIIEDDKTDESKPICTNIDQAIQNLIDIKNQRNIRTLPFTRERRGKITYKEGE